MYCYDRGQGAVPCVWVASRWWYPLVHAGYEISGKPYSNIWHHAHEAIWDHCCCFSCQSQLSTPYLFRLWHSVLLSPNPDMCGRTVFRGKLRIIRRMALGGMTSSASQTSCVGKAMAQDLCLECRPRTPTYIEHILFWWYEHQSSIRRIARIPKLCPFERLIKCRKGQNVT